MPVLKQNQLKIVFPKTWIKSLKVKMHEEQKSKIAQLDIILK